MGNNDTIKKTLIVAVTLCLICSALISFSAVELRDLQEANKTLDKQSKILSAAGLLNEGSDVSQLFESIQSDHILGSFKASRQRRRLESCHWYNWLSRSSGGSSCRSGKNID